MPVVSYRLLLPGALLASALLFSGSAAAEATGWAHLGGGALAHKSGDAEDLEVSPSLAIDMGVGTSTRSPIIAGGYFHIGPVIGHGADLALLARVATSSFQTGPFGLAFDAGAYQRFWGVGSSGFTGQVVLGGPLGLQLALGGQVGSNETMGFGATLGIDLARLTVHRNHFLDWWRNPRPSDAMHAAQLPSR